MVALVLVLVGLAIAVLTADCQPILLADPQAGVIGAVHAGWRGALSGVIEAAVAAMADLGATRIRAVIGPCISQSAYEVGNEFMDEVLAEDAGYHRFFAGGPNGRPMFDLPGFGLMRLREAGVEAEWTRHCTYADPDRFYSYRRSTHRAEADYGRLISAIAL
jgi:YfiH family protein